MAKIESLSEHKEDGDDDLIESLHVLHGVIQLCEDVEQSLKSSGVIVEMLVISRFCEVWIREESYVMCRSCDICVDRCEQSLIDRSTLEKHVVFKGDGFESFKIEVGHKVVVDLGQVGDLAVQFVHFWRAHVAKNKPTDASFLRRASF